MEQKKIDSSSDLQELLTKFKGIAEKTGTRSDDDRTKIDGLITKYEGMLDDGQMDDKVRAAVASGLPVLMKTKVDVAANHSKLLDSLARGIAAIKNIEFGEKTDAVGTEDLDEILDGNVQQDINKGRNKVA